jgi:hypothetical protein
MNSAGIISNHAAKSAAVMGCGIRAKGKAIGFCGILKIVENHTGLNASNFSYRIDFEDFVEVFREIENDRDIAALTGKARPGTPSQNRRAVFSANLDSTEDIFGVLGDDDANGDLAVIGGIRRIKGAASVVEPHFTADLPSKFKL